MEREEEEGGKSGHQKREKKGVEKKEDHGESAERW